MQCQAVSGVIWCRGTTYRTAGGSKVAVIGRVFTRNRIVGMLAALGGIFLSVGIGISVDGNPNALGTYVLFYGGSLVLFLCAGFVLLFGNRDKPPGEGPVGPDLVFGMPELKREHVFDDSGGRAGGAVFLFVPIANIRPEGSDGVAAKNVYGRITIADLNGSVIAGPFDARWGTENDFSTKGSPQSSKLVEIDLPPNSRSRYLDTVAYFLESNRCFIWNDRSMRTAAAFLPNRLDPEFEIEEREFMVRLEVRGSNVAPLSVRMRVWVEALKLQFEILDAAMVNPGQPEAAPGFHPVASDGHVNADTQKKAMRAARLVNSELSASRKRVNDVVTSGRFWNVEVEGLQRTAWDQASDSLMSQAPELWSVVDSAYVLIDAMNATANDHYHRNASALDEEVPRDLERLRIQIRNAQAALKKFYDEGEAQ